ncbi:carbohydrate ABC transporter permease [Herbiconiux sp. KACC 21604]|uniref:Carbohydrate ABC transporter permease n=1 Tax=Herbiconiux sp. A18JL235 TaxID=3152363 RepID=A0AB39BHQ6_9MICO|nr:carbohydrate ABC transporter permease [Herbiconiux sp. SALV-R1]QJU55039.1 carbohydrate ABC transporter permease [Herbiconiux sp. SALV-R1]WPO86179.1 carbohydrate ABC transporter permease [Herbiconiux sp. KACC 21604]
MSIRTSRRIDRDPTSALATVVFIGFALYILAPMLWLVINATKSNSQLYTSFGFWFSDTPQLWQNIVDVFAQRDGIFLRWMGNTLLYSTASALGATLVCFLAGYAFAKWEFRGRSALFWTIMAAMMVPTTALAIPTYQMLSGAGLVNTPWAIILPSIASPFGLYLMRLYTASAVPDELLDAARVDGAGEPRIISGIVLPIVSPGLATVFLISFVNTWNNYLLPLLVLNDVNMYPVTLGLTGWNNQATFPAAGSTVMYPLVITGSLLSIIPLIILFLFMQKYLRNGLTLGAVK